VIAAAESDVIRQRIEAERNPLVPTATVKLTGKPLDFRALERAVFDVMAGRARQRDGDRKPGASGGARCRPII
jgi:hypothetical protein